MKILPVSDLLTSEGLREPTISALIPSVENYTALLMQPLGNIDVSTAGVRNRDGNLAQQQFSAFLAKAVEINVDLAVTPEYSMPWSVLASAIKTGVTPAPGKLWVLGCESIKYSELNALKAELGAAAAMIYEPLVPDNARFLDPLAYVFHVPSDKENGVSKLVVLIQFKSFPMGDADHFEQNGLQRGTVVYRFGGAQSIKLLSLICSDALNFLDEDAGNTYDRALIIHIQLNKSPRHEQFRLYRDRLLRFDGDETELICLNWAGGVREWCADKESEWKNIAGSAWYLKPDKFDDRDETLSANHRRGVYYTWFKTLRVHALFFNYKPAIFLLTATKVAHIGVPAAISRRRGPQLGQAFVWDDATASWSKQDAADDEFSAIVKETGDARGEIIKLATDNPFAAERVLALCAGKVSSEDTWHHVNSLDSCQIDATEIIRRVTYCQDSDEAAGAFRIARLKRCGHLWKILNTHANLPPALADLKAGFELVWDPKFPHSNAISKSKEGRRATLIYMGEESTSRQIETVFKRVAEFIHRASKPSESLPARQRLAIWYRDDSGQIASFGAHRFVRIDKTGDESELSFGREQ